MFWGLRELNAAELLLLRLRQGAPRRTGLGGSVLDRSEDVRRVLGDVQTGSTGVLLVYLDREDLRAVDCLPDAVDVAQVVQAAQLQRRTRSRGGSADMLPVVGVSHGHGGRLRHEVHAQDTDLALGGDLARLGRLRHDRDVAALLGRQDVPLGRRLKRLEQTALDRCDVLVKVAGLTRLREFDAVPLDRVALGTAHVLAQRNERDREVLPDVLTQDQLRALPVSVRVRQGQAAQLTQRGQGGRRRRNQQRLVAPREGGVIHTSEQLVEEGSVSVSGHDGGKEGKEGREKKDDVFFNECGGCLICCGLNILSIFSYEAVI